MVEVVIVELPFPQEDGSEKSYATLTAAHPPTQVGDLFPSAEEASKALNPGAKVVGGEFLENVWFPPHKDKVEAVGQTLSHTNSKILAFDQETGAFAAEIVCWELGPSGYAAATVQPKFRYWTGVLNSGLGWLQVFESPGEATGACQEMIKNLEKPDFKGFIKRNF